MSHILHGTIPDDGPKQIHTDTPEPMMNMGPTITCLFAESKDLYSRQESMHADMLCPSQSTATHNKGNPTRYMSIATLHRCYAQTFYCKDGE